MRSTASKECRLWNNFYGQMSRHLLNQMGRLKLRVVLQCGRLSDTGLDIPREEKCLGAASALHVRLRALACASFRPRTVFIGVPLCPFPAYVPGPSLSERF